MALLAAPATGAPTGTVSATSTVSATAAANRTARPRVLLAPVTVTPTKPLTPSHLKGLLWTDVMLRATAGLAEVTLRYSPTTYHLTEQTLGFWEFLDRTAPDTDCTTLSEDRIGALYMAYRAQEGRADETTMRAYADAVEHHGWVHPAGSRVLDLWAGHYARLGMHDPGLRAHQPPSLGLEETLGLLADRGLCLDLRSHGGPAYLDVTRHGLPLRRIVTPHGRPNYLACALRELLPLATAYDEIVLLCDQELDADYQLLDRVLTAFGATVRRVLLGRVPIEGRIRSARHGGWAGHTVGDLLDGVCGTYDEPVVRLGMRLYFIAVLGAGPQQSFQHDALRQSLTRAARLLSRGAGDATDPAPVAEVLARHRTGHLYVNPYRLTSALLARHRPGPTRELLQAVYL
ncbi:hypothetical protein [Streptomyces sp. NPDC047000]|uniref:hypothetical protein n=1 Tax=Streptomyces sp. NPDC047000 TaxID=3155474 RepID=UPI00340A9726